MKVCLYFGSFNPIHNGHLSIAKYLLENFDFQEVWFVVSPANPLKNATGLANENDRLKMVQLAIENEPNLCACDIEFTMPKPSFTIDTLNQLKSKYPHNQFVLLLGEDNLASFTKWRDFEKIVDEFEIYVYPRKEVDDIHKTVCENIIHQNIHKIEAPLFDISSTLIRSLIHQRKSFESLVPKLIWYYINRNKIYS